MKFFTIGYGGRSPAELVALLKEHRVATVVDVRIEPTRASMGSFVRAKSPEKGIQRLLGEAGIGYVSAPRLGNPFRDDAAWRATYDAWFRERADDLLRCLADVPRPFCLMCCEKLPEACHREVIANVMVERGDEVAHIGRERRRGGSE